MRSDFVSYVIAAVWFIVAIYFAYAPQVIDHGMATAVATISAIIGICFIGVGYMLRTKKAKMVSIVPAPTVTETQTEITPTSTASQSQATEIDVEKTPPKTSKKPVRRRRKKTE